MDELYAKGPTARQWLCPQGTHAQPYKGEAFLLLLTWYNHLR